MRSQHRRLLEAGDIDVVVNLTIPDAHFTVTKNILNAGKHAYTEKPMVLSLAEGQELAALAMGANLRIGSAPDTFHGGAHQKARAFLDDGAVGDIVAGSAHVMSHGMEHWHPNPVSFSFQAQGPCWISGLIMRTSCSFWGQLNRLQL